MNVDDVQRASWSVTQQAAAGDHRGQRAFDELVEACRELCQRNFPDEDGYETTRFHLSGPLQGTRFVTHRGRLRMVLSVQRFERSRPSRLGTERPLEVRVVASMAMISDGASSEAQRALAGWGVAGCALGTLGVSALALGSAGLISAWVQAALLVPALIAWRIYATIGMARSMRRQAALSSARTQLTSATLMDALPRWRKLTPALAAEGELIAERLGLPPFRNPARALRPASSAA